MKANKKSALLSAWLPVAAWMAAIFYFSAMTMPPTAEAGVLSNKVLHVIEYAGLGLLFVRAIEKHGFRRLGYKRLVVFAFAFALFYGATDEFHQLFVPGRHAAVADVLLDSFGGALGGIAYAFVPEKLRARLRL